MVSLCQVVVLFTLLVTSSCASTCEPLSPLWVPLGPCHLPGISSWGAQIGVVNASQQICITPSTVTSSTLLIAPSVCDEAQLKAENMTFAQCASRRGGFVDLSNLSTSTSDVEQASLQALNPGWSTIQGADAFKTSVTTTLYLHGNVDNGVTMLDIIITDGSNHTTSQLALGNQSVLLDTLVSTRLIGRRSFGLDAGSTSITSPRGGSLVFGGYDSASVSGAFVEYPMTYNSILNDRVCPLQVTIKRLALRQPGLSDDVLFGEEWPLQACIEPYDNLFRLPDTLVNKNLVPTVQKILDSQTVSFPPNTDIYVNEPGLLFALNDSNSFNGSLVFTLDQNFTVEIPSYEIMRPLRGLATNGSVIINDNLAELQVYPVEPLNAAVLGKVFLSQLYLHVDYERQVLELANINTDINSILPVPDAKDMDSGCSTASKKISGTTVGVAIGANVGLLLLLAALGWFLFRRWKKRHPTQSPRPPQDPKVESAPEIVAIEHSSPFVPRKSSQVVAANATSPVQPWISNSEGASLPEVSIHQQVGGVHRVITGDQHTNEMQGTSVNQRATLGELPSPSSDPRSTSGPIADEPKERTMSYASELSNEPPRAT